MEQSVGSWFQVVVYSWLVVLLVWSADWGWVAQCVVGTVLHSASWTEPSLSSSMELGCALVMSQVVAAVGMHQQKGSK